MEERVLADTRVRSGVVTTLDICAYLAEQVERKAHVREHALRIGRLEGIWSLECLGAVGERWRARVVQIVEETWH